MPPTRSPRTPALLHVAAGSLGLVTFDASDPAAMTMTDRAAFGQSAVSVWAGTGSLALAQRADDLPGSIFWQSPGLPTGAAVPYSEAADALAAGGLALLLDKDALDVYDATNPSP